MLDREVSPLKTRVPIIVLLVVLLGLACFTGVHLKQSLDAEHELRSQMGDLSLATMTDNSASSRTVSLGESSLRQALDSVRTTAHRQEVFLGLELLGVGLLVLLLRLKRRED